MNKKSFHINILIIEDDDLDTKILANGLLRFRNPPVKLYRAIDGITALELLTTDNVDIHIANAPIIIILDLNLPRMNGIEFIKKIRAHPQLASLLVFILSTSSSIYEIREAYELNIGGYFVKAHAGPLYKDFLQMLEQYLSIVSLKYH